MAHFTFRGGITLHGNKDRTMNSPIEEILPGRELVFPMMYKEQPLVVPGEYVVKGQLIARAEDDPAQRIHASVSGIVKKIEERETVYGQAVRCIVLENDEKYKELDCGEFVEADDLENRQILARILSAGIINSAHPGIPVCRMLDIAEPMKIRHVIVNCAECEPYLTGKYRCAVERPEWIVEGLRILLKLFPNAKGILAIENDRPEAITALQKIFADSKNMKIIPMQRKYPQDMERMLIYACTGKKINSSKTPEEARCIVLDSDTVNAICNAVTFGKPMTRRVLTVSGNAVREPKNILAPVGMSIAELIASTGEYVEKPEKIICGGPMRGTQLLDTNVPLMKEMQGIVCLKAQENAQKARPDGSCIGCGFCVDACNEQLLPTRLAGYALAGNREMFVKLGGMECCECGSCSYVCPAKRPLTEMIRMMKNETVFEMKE